MKHQVTYCTSFSQLPIPFFCVHFLSLHVHLQKEVLETVYLTLQEENSLCLADVCEVFRCDVIGRVIVPDYWDVALCLEDDMKSLHRRCSVSRMDACF